MNWTVLFFLLLILGVVLLRIASRARTQTGVPEGRIVATDMGNWRRLDRPLFSRQYELTGRPDYIVADGADLIPVEVKSAAAPEQPYLSHVLQLAAYCLLTAETSGRRPPYGIIRYADQTFEIPFTRQLEDQLLDVLDDMREALDMDDVDLNHNDPRRCVACGHRQQCADRLA